MARASAAVEGEFLWLTAYATNDKARGAYRRIMDVEEDNVVAYALTGSQLSSVTKAAE